MVSVFFLCIALFDDQTLIDRECHTLSGDFDATTRVIVQASGTDAEVIWTSDDTIQVEYDLDMVDHFTPMCGSTPIQSRMRF